MKKRNFLKQLGLLGIAPLTSSFFSFTEEDIEINIDLEDEEFWKNIRAQYNLTDDYINLESGYYNIIPNPTLKKLIKHTESVNYEGSFYMRKKLQNDRRNQTTKLANFVGCSPKNLIVTRNTTESLDLIISGYPWKKGDEVIFAVQEYGAMRLMFEQIAERYGVIINKISIPNHPTSDEEIISLYTAKITAKTKLILVSHMINITGQILPIRKLCDKAHKMGVEVLVDGAHCVGHFDFKISDLNCDYYGSSLHKWLAAPLGNGLLYIDQKHVSKIWPLLADYQKNKENINRLNHLGTHPAHITLGINDAIDFINQMGMSRKESRLNELRTYWMRALREVPNVQLNTPFESKRACGIGNIGLKNMSPKEMADRLLEKYKIFTVSIDENNVRGCRITPNVFTSFNELDHFILAVKQLASI